MPIKGRNYLTIDLKTPELRTALNTMIAEDKISEGEMNASLFVRKLIRTEYASRKMKSVLIVPACSGANIRKELCEDSPLAEAGKGGR